eukprot:gnl/MRDRNA2_/MRDRNA2_168209_c0_seq1.p1 gnl/MRDRNA2_/MRDRNA2_168209_c0~~gnl/MRDRNA2_/MRDRNA2_168209_c0_seq1.p1  ORF type:complete len:398 (+),score=72.61 gnl/MRDRNA2_/MRDRNA2_168209_c0_seq1:3-1196(+)
MLPVLRMTGDTVAELSVTPEQKVQEVKRQLEGPSQTPSAYQRLLHEGCILEKHKTLGEESVRSGSTLILVREPVEVGAIDKVTRFMCKITCDASPETLDPESLVNDPKAVMGFLLENGADPNIADFAGLTPLQIAARESGRESNQESSLDIVQALLAHERTKVEWRTLELALYANHIGVCEAILKDARFKPLIDNRDPEGNTALMIALQREHYGHCPCVWQTILACKADVNLKNRKNEDALALALRFKNKLAIETLSPLTLREKVVTAEPLPKAVAQPTLEEEAIAQAQAMAAARAQAMAEAGRQAFQEAFQDSFYQDQYAAQSFFPTGYYGIPMETPAETQVAWASGVPMDMSATGIGYGVQIGVPGHQPWCQPGYQTGYQPGYLPSAHAQALLRR